MTKEPKTTTVVIRMKVCDTIAFNGHSVPSSLHERLCCALLEGDLDAIDQTKEHLVDIEVIKGVIHE